MTLQLAVDAAASLSMPVAFSVAAIGFLDASGYRSWMPAVAMFSPVLLLYRLPAPSPLLVVLAIASWLVVLLARGPRCRTLRLSAILACGVCTLTLQLLGTLGRVR